MRKGVGGGPGLALSHGSEISGGLFHHQMVHIASEHNGSEHIESEAPELLKSLIEVQRLRNSITTARYI